MKTDNFVEIYTHNILQLHEAINAAGGSSGLILAQKPIIAFMNTLAKNSISLTADYVRPQE
jgi:hypothetical protein